MSSQNASVRIQAGQGPQGRLSGLVGRIVDRLNRLASDEQARSHSRLPFLSPQDHPIIDEMFCNIADRIGHIPVDTIQTEAGDDRMCGLVEAMFCPKKEQRS